MLAVSYQFHYLGSRWTGYMGVDRRHTVNWLVSCSTDHDRRDAEPVGLGGFNEQERAYLTGRIIGRQSDLSAEPSP